MFILPQTTPSCQGGCVIGTPHPRSSPHPCNVAGVSRGRIPITVHLMRLHEFGPLWTRSTRDHVVMYEFIQNPRVLVTHRCCKFGVRSGVVSLYVSDPKRLRSSSGHGVGWRTGVDFQHTGSFTHSAKFLSYPGDVTHGGLGEFVSCPYFFPQHYMP